MEIIDLLKQSPLFTEVDKADLEELVPSTDIETYASGQIIIQEGDIGTSFFLIKSGSVEVVRSLGKPGQEVVANLGAGDFFGEIANMKHLPRSASVRALEETVCLVIQRLYFDSYIDQFPSVLAKVESALATRFDEEEASDT